MTQAWFHRVLVKGLIGVGVTVVTSLSFTGCDEYWPPAQREQIIQLLTDLSDTLDDQQRLEPINAELRTVQTSVQREMNEQRRGNEELPHRLNTLTKRPPPARLVKRVSVTRAKPTRMTAAKGAPPLLRLTHPPMRGKRVARIQKLLRRHGLPIRIDGIYGGDTAAAVRGFQRAHGLPSDGIVRPATERTLQRDPDAPKRVRRLMVRRPPLKGRDVVHVQRALRRAGYRLRVDGRFGPQTRRAVIRFQRKHGLTPDGVVGPRTWARLKTTP